MLTRSHGYSIREGWCRWIRAHTSPRDAVCNSANASRRFETMFHVVVASGNGIPMTCRKFSCFQTSHDSSIMLPCIHGNDGGVGGWGGAAEQDAGKAGGHSSWVACGCTARILGAQMMCIYVPCASGFFQISPRSSGSSVHSHMTHSVLTQLHPLPSGAVRTIGNKRPGPACKSHRHAASVWE